MNELPAPSGRWWYVAIAELALVFPAALFMGALFVGNLQPPPLEPSETARRLVEWFVARPFLGLDIFLITQPLAAFFVGCAAMFGRWSRDGQFRQATLETVAVVRAHLAILLIAVATLAAGGILTVVAIHMIGE